MAQHSRIECTDHTFNGWWGCTTISPGCDYCYAETWDWRLGGAHWGAHAPCRVMSDAYWRQPLRWNAILHPEGRPWRVFCASMADVFDNQAPPGQRERLWALIRATPNLEWLLLTKRPQNLSPLLPPDWGEGYPNVRLGITVENPTEAERRIPRLAAVPMRLAPFLSCEPLLAPLDLTPFLERIGWVIVGGKSGPRARPMLPAWVIALWDQCAQAHVPFFFKQWGGPNKKQAGRLLDGRIEAAFPVDALAR